MTRPASSPARCSTRTGDLRAAWAAAGARAKPSARMLLTWLLAGLSLWAFLARMGAMQAIVSPSPILRLTNDGRSVPLAWTPDGQSLLVRRPGRMLPGQQLSELWLAAADASGERLLSDNALRPTVHGDELAYLSFVARGEWQAVGAAIDGSASSVIGAARWELPPAWVEGELIYLNRDGRLAVPDSPLWRGTGWYLQLSTTSLACARLSPDGRHVAHTDGRTLYVVGAEGTTVVAHGDQTGSLVWSPTGSHLAYILHDGGPSPQLRMWSATTRRSRTLLAAETTFIGTPAWSPDEQTLAFARQPTGSGANTAGDIWLIQADGTGLRPLARTPADERAPCWSPDGQALAFALEDDVWVADLTSPGVGPALSAATRDVLASQGAEGMEWQSGISVQNLGPLDTIRVMHDDTGNTCRNVPHGQVDVYPFEAYVKRVVPNEMSAEWPSEALKAQAVAARTYAWRRALGHRAPYPDPGYDVWDSTRDQLMCDNPHPLSDSAVDATEGQYIAYNGSIVYASFYCARAGSPTNHLQEHNLEAGPYLRPVDDPVSFGETRDGHGWGMSQWGAYRWASWYGWDYQQILTHYYSFSTVEPADTYTMPLAGLTLPWNNGFLNTDYAYLRANATDEGAVVSVTFSAQLTGTWATIATDTDGSNGWGYVWPVLNVSDTFTPSIGLRAAVRDDHGNETQSGPYWVGLHRTPPTGTLAVSNTAVNTLTVVLSVSASDPEPVSGTIQVGVGNDNWVWEDTDLVPSGGTTEADLSAGDGSAWHASTGTESVLRGPWTTALPAGHGYRALFRIRAPATALTTSLELARLDVSVDSGATLLGVRYLRGTDFRQGGVYREFPVDLDYSLDSGALGFRTTVYGVEDLWVDRVRVISYPVDVAGPAQFPWTLPAHEGAVTVTAKYVDRAGNLSRDVHLGLTITDDSPPQDWRTFWCSALTCTVQVHDVIAGLDVSSAEYRLSTDGGASWGGWAPASCSGSDGSHAWETVVAAGVPFGDAPARNVLQFRVSDSALAANTGQSPPYAVWRTFLPLVARGHP